jgi:hypothetical protein
MELSFPGIKETDSERTPLVSKHTIGYIHALMIDSVTSLSTEPPKARALRKETMVVEELESNKDVFRSELRDCLVVYYVKSSSWMAPAGCPGHLRSSASSRASSPTPPPTSEGDAAAAVAAGEAGGGGGDADIEANPELESDTANSATPPPAAAAASAAPADAAPAAEAAVDAAPPPGKRGGRKGAKGAKAT